MEAVKEITKDGAKFVDGKEREYDCIILATGYKSNVPSWLKVNCWLSYSNTNSPLFVCLLVVFLLFIFFILILILFDQSLSFLHNWWHYPTERFLEYRGNSDTASLYFLITLFLKTNLFSSPQLLFFFNNYYMKNGILLK